MSSPRVTAQTRKIQVGLECDARLWYGFESRLLALAVGDRAVARRGSTARLWSRMLDQVLLAFCTITLISERYFDATQR